MNPRRTILVGLWVASSVFLLWLGITDLNRGRIGFGIGELVIAGFVIADNIDSAMREYRR
jgi:hypothetical protein